MLAFQKENNVMLPISISKDYLSFSFKTKKKIKTISK